MQEIVWQIYNDGTVSDEHFLSRVPFIEPSTNKKLYPFGLDTLPSPRILKTHLPHRRIPKSENKEMQCKYVYVARNPKDVAVSYFHFTDYLRKRGNGLNGPWEYYVKLFIEGNGKFRCIRTECGPINSDLQLQYSSIFVETLDWKWGFFMSCLFNQLI